MRVSICDHSHISIIITQVERSTKTPHASMYQKSLVQTKTERERERKNEMIIAFSGKYNTLHMASFSPP